ncbi:cytokine SCM-1 beta-like [Silurus meridionalis]|nr:cytokine SCM-1 beta-like [Silurus meridionalis]
MSLAEPLNQGAEAMPVSCCLKTCETKVRKEQLKSYTIQDIPLCPVKAVRFVTEKDLTLCSDPFSPWAINTMIFLDNRGAQQGNLQ